MSRGHYTTEIDMYFSKEISASQGGVMAIEFTPSHSDTRKSRNDVEVSVPLPDDCIHEHVDEEQNVGLDCGTALDATNDSAAF